jgi:hypothetical protein
MAAQITFSQLRFQRDSKGNPVHGPQHAVALVESLPGDRRRVDDRPTNAVAAAGRTPRVSQGDRRVRNRTLQPMPSFARKRTVTQ